MSNCLQKSASVESRISLLKLYSSGFPSPRFFNSNIAYQSPHFTACAVLSMLLADHRRLRVASFSARSGAPVCNHLRSPRFTHFCRLLRTRQLCFNKFWEAGVNFEGVLSRLHLLAGSNVQSSMRSVCSCIPIAEVLLCPMVNKCKYDQICK